MHANKVTDPTITYLTTTELAARIKYDACSIRNQLKDSVLLEGVHYIRPFGGRKILYLWETIESDMSRISQRGANHRRPSPLQ